MSMLKNSFDASQAQARCLRHRRRILEISQRVPALHIAPAFSCLEIVDTIYHGLMRRKVDGDFKDVFILSKGHGVMAQYALLEDLGILPSADLDNYCTPHGLLGAHPDLGVPGVAAATGSLGHGLGIGLGMALAEKIGQARKQDPANIYVVLSDGELQEGSSWEAIMLAPSLGADNLVLVIDNNDFQSLGRTSETHPSFYPLESKFSAFGWNVGTANGHDAAAMHAAIADRPSGKPFCLIARTVKGRGVSYMENVPMWHYRSPNPQEYSQAMAELAEISG